MKYIQIPDRGQLHQLMVERQLWDVNSPIDKSNIEHVENDKGHRSNHINLNFGP